MNVRSQQTASGRSRQGSDESSGGLAAQRRQVVEAGTLRRASLQMSLFGSLPRSGPASPLPGASGGPRPGVGNDSRLTMEADSRGRSGADNPHLAKARRIARQMRRMPDHSPEETRAGLAICRQLKAYLRD